MDHEDMSTWTDEAFEDEIDRLRKELAAEKERADRAIANSSEWERLGKAVTKWAAQNCGPDKGRDARKAWEEYTARAEAAESSNRALAERLDQARIAVELALEKKPGMTFPDAEVETLMCQALSKLTPVAAEEKPCGTCDGTREIHCGCETNEGVPICECPAKPCPKCRPGSTGGEAKPCLDCDKYADAHRQGLPCPSDEEKKP